MKIKFLLPKIILVTFFILTLMINLQIGLLGDDYFYASFAKNDFWEHHKNHYLKDNGRAIVHILASIFLALPHFFWQVINSLMLTRYYIFWKQNSF